MDAQLKKIAHPRTYYGLNPDSEVGNSSGYVHSYVLWKNVNEGATGNAGGVLQCGPSMQRWLFRSNFCSEIKTGL
jgi:hypothetical protein